MTAVTLKSPLARRLPDPVFAGCERYIFLCPVESLPPDIPRDSNPRAQNIDRRIYREIEDHLLNEEGTPNTFHLKNKGITILADRVIKKDDETYQVVFSPKQGIVDGGHTYALILKNQADLRDAADRGSEAVKQFVKLEVLTGMDAGLTTEIAGGLNTAVQVQEMSLANLADKFGWIKDELANEPYLKHIAFRENESDTTYDVRDLLVILDLFNTVDFPNDQSNCPVRAYTSKEAVLDAYLKKPANYERLRPILKDILVLHDTISSGACQLHNDSGGKAGKLSFVEGPRKRAKDRYVFIDKPVGDHPVRGALFPMVGAFRWLVGTDPKTGRVAWRESFPDVLALWQETGAELMRATQETSVVLGRNPNAVGKSRNHWANLHRIVAMRHMMAQRGHPAK